MTSPERLLERHIRWPVRGEADLRERATHEWIVTNGLGGYASGTISGLVTRRFHGLLVAALAPHGRMMMLTHLLERVRLPDRRIVWLGDERQLAGAAPDPAAPVSAAFRLELGLPVWTYRTAGFVIEKRLVMPHRQNTVHVIYRLLEGDGSIRIALRPSLHFRPHDASVSVPLVEPYTLRVTGDRYELVEEGADASLRLHPVGSHVGFTIDARRIAEVLYATEESRGYEARGDLWSPGYFRTDLAPGERIAISASTEAWEALDALDPDEALAAEQDRRRHLIAQADAQGDPIRAELVLAADQFIVVPVGRIGERSRALAAGHEPRTVLAGYHWFTDWGRDTMISLEGLALATGRQTEAGHILRTFADCVRDGLIPNLFPEGDDEGLYHTADATLWFFHALDRYSRAGGREVTDELLPLLHDIIRRHIEGTRFGIGMDHADALLRQGAEGYQLTWMDAKVGDWVVTPRRGKAVEINALWYNALCVLRDWTAEAAPPGGLSAADLDALAARVCDSFNARFWFAEGQYLFDVVDGENGDDAACRPNQVFALALPHPVLSPDRWARVLHVVETQLLTPVGLRSLSPGHPDYRARYYGDLRTRDAAYHQGTVWSWLIGPFVEAWLKVHPGPPEAARRFLEGLVEHLGEAGAGTISEIFDGDPPFTPRGCIAQAWSVAELLRCWILTGPAAGEATRPSSRADRRAQPTPTRGGG